MYNILVVDYSSYKDTLAGIFREAGFHVEISESAFEAMSKLKAMDIHLIVSEIDLPGDNAFALYNYLSNYYPYIPAIMITEKDMETFFEHIFKEGIGNVMQKPMGKEELINFSNKLITKKNIFGLKNYFKSSGDGIKKIRITTSDQIKKAVQLVLKQIEDWEFPVVNKAALALILNELIINAVYHSHGYTGEKEKRSFIKLKDDEFVDVCFARNENNYAISITDYKGKLKKEKILDSIYKAIEERQLILRAAETGEEIIEMVSETGRGIDLVRQLAKEYYFVIKANVKTEIILLFDAKAVTDQQGYSSHKIIEDFD